MPHEIRKPKIAVAVMKNAQRESWTMAWSIILYFPRGRRKSGGKRSCIVVNYNVGRNHTDSDASSGEKNDRDHENYGRLHTRG